MNVIIIFIQLILANIVYCQCPSSIASLGQGNGLQVCWNTGAAPTILDSIKYDNVSYNGNFVNAGAGDCWRTTDPATLSVNGNHKFEFYYLEYYYTCDVNNGEIEEEYITMDVSFSSFDVRLVGNVIMVRWATESEENNDYFVVQRSTDGIHFEDIAIIGGKNTPSEYSYQDYTISANKTLYYRLEQFNFDGTSFLTNVMSINTDNVLVHQVFPNPASDILNIINEHPEEEMICTITDISGKLVMQKNIQEDSKLIALDISFLAPSLYVLELKQFDQAQSLKLVVK